MKTKLSIPYQFNDFTAPCGCTVSLAYDLQMTPFYIGFGECDHTEIHVRSVRSKEVYDDNVDYLLWWHKFGQLADPRIEFEAWFAGTTYALNRAMNGYMEAKAQMIEGLKPR